MIGTIALDIFNLDVGVFASDEQRIATLRAEGCSDLDEHNSAALAHAHLDFTEDGDPRLSIVIKPKATKATWAHECVHVADFAMTVLGIPTDAKNTEIRGYLVGHIFAGLEDLQ